MSERQSLFLAGTAHLALLAALSLSWAWSQRPLPPAEEAVPVDVVDIADVPRTPTPPQPSREAAPQETTAPPPTPAEPQPEPEPQPAPTAVPPPEVKPEPPKPPAKADKPRPETKPLDTQNLANLIDKALPKAKTKPLDTSKLASTIAAAAPKSAAVDPRAAATLAQAIRAQVTPCWNPPIGGAGAGKLTVTLHADFAQSGAVIGTPQAVGMTGQADPAFARAFRESAVRAVLRCAPLKLPPKLYDLWKSVAINFDPADMT